ncbi:MAG: bifunctional glutamate N-acetyltransferase/amino-acid acetyltransferase ArgJ [Trueperella sp.]|nr:bifunctional glutamate N-acetyltransferase/amino-acid acetyltransferase ArgJ [Trueperella sp.]
MITKPSGFLAAGVAAGLKKSGGRDLALIVNQGPEFSAGLVTTTNRVFAAPVQWTREMADGTFRAIIANSGGANAATGVAGYQQSAATAQHVAELLGIKSADVAVCSTGMIGELLDLDALLAGATAAKEQLGDNWQDAADAIRTTDTRSKTAEYLADTFTVGGIAKGAGMLAPAMATMLCFITTDAALSSAEAQEIIEYAVDKSFNRIDSDGAMSTNDTVILLASGAAGRADLAAVRTAVTAVAKDLARQLIADAEGAAHDIAISVRGAHSETAALAVARAVSRSNLVKTAIFGNDPNWGRVLSQVGTVPAEVAPFDPGDVDIYFNGIQVCRGGGVGADRALVDLTPREVSIEIDLHAGTAQATLWTNDLTHGYVHENSAYSS